MKTTHKGVVYSSIQAMAKAIMLDQLQTNSDGMYSGDLIAIMNRYGVNRAMFDIARASLKDDGYPITTTKQGEYSRITLNGTKNQQRRAKDQMLHDHYARTTRNARALSVLGDHGVRNVFVGQAVQLGLLIGKTPTEVDLDCSPRIESLVVR